MEQQSKPYPGYVPWQESWTTYPHEERVYLRRVTAPHRYASDWRQAAHLEAEIRGIHLEELQSGWLTPWRAAQRARDRRIARRQERQRRRYMALCGAGALVGGSAYLAAVLWPYSPLLAACAGVWGVALAAWAFSGRGSGFQ